MIGVIADSEDFDVVREFFELFKTPWEFYRADQQYEVLLCAADVPFDVTANLVLVYAGRKVSFDEKRNISINKRVDGFCVLSAKQTEIPIYGGAVSLTTSATPLLSHQNGRECAAFYERIGHTKYVRVGYDLFGEIRLLLTKGQPPAQAHIPTLELHFDFLRRWIIGSGTPLVEIPPVPGGYRFIACLTHDVDHPFIRRHALDHTTVGFLFRTVVFWFWDLVRGRITFRNVITNWKATLKLPFILLGLAKDFWSNFDEQYASIEKGLPATFFVVPFQGRPGIGSKGRSPKRRAAGYGARDVAGPISRIIKAGNEVCLHGIDAWCDRTRARGEMDEIRSLTGAQEIGVRMHWLYQNEQTPSVLEEAGADYDSTAGYAETIGYRAGATQAYKPMGANRLLELPLHVMDTALFYLSYLGLTHRGAMERLAPIFDNAVRYGGCLTVNWHDRSLAPERLWGATYYELLNELQRRDPWFATAGDAVAWFRKRRAAAFVANSADPGTVQVQLAGGFDHNLPGLRLRSYKLRAAVLLDDLVPEDYIDLHVEQDIPTALPASQER